MPQKAKLREMPALSSEFLEAVLNDVGIGLVVMDQNLQVTLANKAATTLFGGPPPWRETVTIQDAEGNEISLEPKVRQILDGEDLLPEDFRVTLPDGRARWLLAAAYRFSVFGFTGVFAIIADETGRVEARQAQEALERLGVAERITRAMIHDFNNVLSLTAGNVTLALDDRSMSETSRQYLEQASLTLQKAKALSARLIKFSRAEKTYTSPLQINDVVASALELARPLLGGAVKVQSHLQPDLPMVQGNAVDIEQALLNLIMNALDAMPEGGHLTVRSELAAIPQGGVKGEKTYVLISVADTGIGIPEHLQAKIFEPFFTTKPEGKGTGLGLSSAHGIVLEHSGYIKVQSSPGAGSNFSIYIPAGIRALR